MPFSNGENVWYARRVTSGTSTDLATSTTHGRVLGATHRGGARFLGIPFAAAPTGALRFRPPQPAVPWDGVRPCLEPGPVCPQMTVPEEFMPMPDFTGRGLPMSEDCLSLNVYTPAADDGRRPVVVWIHGGAFVAGSGAAPTYDGSSFARDGVVFVSINYRLHALGFLYLDELFGIAGSGNAGVLDQIAALEWVRDNIAAFGGDPDNVTVMGESAGAISVGTLLALPAARGLFRRAVLQSGAAQHNLSSTSAERVAVRVLERLGVRPGDADALATISADALWMVAQQVGFMEMEELLRDEHAGVRTAFAPVIDGVLLPQRAIEGIAAGSSDGVDVLIGTCADEYRVFYWGLPEPMRSMAGAPDPATYFRGSSREVDEVLRTYAAGRPGADSLDLALAVASDAMFGIPGVRLAEAKAARGDRVWMQELAWPTPVLGGSLGACHALDLPFLFDDLAYPSFLGDAPPQAVADDLHGACVRFIADGDPNGGRLPQWPGYDERTRAVMTYDLEPTLLADPRRDERLAWDGVW